MNNKTAKLTGLLMLFLVFSLLITSGNAFAKTKKVKTSATVSTQKELNKALKNKKLKKLTIKTNKIIKFEIPNKYFGSIELKVNAPNASFNSWGKLFKSLDINAASWTQNMDVKKVKLHNSTSFTLTENIKIDTLTVLGESTKATYRIKGSANKFIIKAKCYDASICGSINPVEDENGTFILYGTDITNITKLDINGGGDFKASELTVANFNLNSPTSLSVSNTSKIANINIMSGGNGSHVETDSSLTANIYSPSSVKIGSTAEGTAINIKEMGAITEVTNLTTKAIAVNTPNGYVNIDYNSSMTVNPATDGVQNSLHDKNALPPG